LPTSRKWIRPNQQTSLAAGEIVRPLFKGAVLQAILPQVSIVHSWIDQSISVTYQGFFLKNTAKMFGHFFALFFKTAKNSATVSSGHCFF
jgi:hypothetical protein